MATSLTPQLEFALTRDFPMLYRDGRVQMFEHGDGWEPLIRELSRALESLIVAQLPDRLLGHAVSLPVAVEVKQNMGALHFVVEGAVTPLMVEAINDAELRARQTCEQCGAPGTLSQTGWRSVTCLRHE